MPVSGRERKDVPAAPSDRPARRRILLLAPLVLVLGAVLGYWLMGSHRGAPGAGAEKPARGSVDQDARGVTHQPTLRGSDWQRTFRRLEAEPGRTAASATSSSIRIFGTVAHPDEGAESNPFVVYGVIGANDGSPVVVFKERIEEGSVFDVGFAPDLLRGATAMSVGVLWSGCRRETKEVEVRRGAEVEVHFVLTRGGRIAGRVTDALGRPIEPLDLVAFASPSDCRVVSGRTLDVEARSMVPASSAFSSARATTSLGGAFEFIGLGPGEHVIVADSDEWFIQPGPRASPDRDDVALIAQEALSLRLAVVDDETGASVPVTGAEIEVQPVDPEVNRYVVDVGGLNGSIRAMWPARATESERGFALSVSVTAPGYLRQRQVIEVLAGTRSAEREIRLQRILTGTLLLDVVDAAGHPFTGAMRVNLVNSTEPSRREGSIELHSSEPGHYEAAIPSGRWRFRAYPEGPLGRMVSFGGEIHLTAGSEARARGALQPYGSIRILLDRPDGHDPTSPLGGFMSTGDIPGYVSASSTIEVHAPETLLAVVPPGVWELTVDLPTGPMQARVRVSEGETAEWRID